MVTHCSNPIKLIRFVTNPDKTKEVYFMNLKTFQLLSRPSSELEDDDNGNHLTYELNRLEKEYSEYKFWMRANS